MDEISDETKAGFRRVELLTGPGRRRRWSSEEKARIVAETLLPGVRVSDVARRWQLHPQQLFGWRHQARKDGAAQRQLMASRAGPSFVPIVTEAAHDTAAAGAKTGPRSIEIELAGAVVRVVSGVDADWLTAVLRAVRCSSGAT
jgi:transposase